MDADEKQFAVIYPKLKEHGEQGLPILIGEIEKKVPAKLPSSDAKRETLAKRQANAAVALLRMDRPEKVWPLLKHGPDPRVRSYLIHRLGPLRGDAGVIIRRFAEEPNITIRRALHGNLYTWCQEAWDRPNGGDTSDDTEDRLVVASTNPRVLRGGSFLYPAANVRSASRYGSVPTRFEALVYSAAAFSHMPSLA
jgi:hypothetical protein